MTSTPIFFSSARRRTLGYAAASLASVALLLTAGCGKKEEAAPPAPPTVEVVTVTQKDVPIYQEWIGSLDGDVNAVIRPQVTGYLVKQNYREGDLVKKGQLLFEIDPRTFQAAVDQAKGLVAQQRASTRPRRPIWRGSSRWRPRTRSARRISTTPPVPSCRRRPALDQAEARWRPPS
jgi:multidrug efflux pump subunit AcrA (membrane-fusion protein)